MIKMYASGTKKDGQPVRLVIFGLSHGNIDRLRDGKPIKFTGDTCGLEKDIEFLIYSGETEQAMQREMAQFIGPDTKVHIDPRLKD